MSASGGEFPEPPKGSPGGIRAAARSIGEAGQHFDTVAQGLTASSGALQADWQGWAAGSYLAASQGLDHAVKTGAETFRSCEKAVSGYADALQRAQDEIRRLHGEWIKAKAREAAARTHLGDLAGKMMDAKPAQIGGIEDGMNAAGREETAAGDDAARIARRAHEVLDEFRREERRQAGVLSGERPAPGQGTFGPGASPFSGAGVGTDRFGTPGFGIPGGGLAPYAGVINVEHPNTQMYKGISEWVFGGFGAQSKTAPVGYESTNVPGYQRYWTYKNGHSPDAGDSPDDLTNAIVFVATAGGSSAAEGLFAAARGVAGGLGRKLALTGGREVVDAASTQAEREAAAYLAPTGTRAEAIRAAGRNAANQKQFEVDALQGGSLKNLGELASKAGAPLPPGTADILGHLAESQAMYRYYAVGKLLRLQAELAARGTPAALRAARAVERVLHAVSR